MTYAICSRYLVISDNKEQERTAIRCSTQYYKQLLTLHHQLMDYRYVAGASVMVVIPDSLLKALRAQTAKNGDQEGLSCLEAIGKSNSVEIVLEN